MKRLKQSKTLDFIQDGMIQKFESVIFDLEYYCTSWIKSVLTVLLKKKHIPTDNQWQCFAFRYIDGIL